MPSRTDDTAPLNRDDSEDTHDTFLADDDKSNSSIDESHYEELPDNTNVSQDAIAPGQAPAAMLPEEVQEPRVDHSGTRVRLVPFPSLADRTSTLQNPRDALRTGHPGNPATMTNPFRFPAGAPTESAERSAVRDDTSSSTPRLPTVSPAATSFADQASRLNSPGHRRTVNFAASQPPPSCLAFSSTARIVNGRTPYPPGEYPARVLSELQQSASSAAAVTAGTGCASPGGQLWHGPMIDALRKDRERARMASRPRRTGLLRLNVGPGARTIGRRGGLNHPRGRCGNLSTCTRNRTCTHNLASANRATASGESSQAFAAQDQAIREARDLLHEAFEQRRASREAQQQEDEDAEEDEEPASKTEGERMDEDS
ncbi:unnamed protein product [Clonostachys byssicola]|uniref:Uncharacterized protein n=1 Tax=Clonostachys byssicola TaxID=160290 RepID=A0A9N9UGX7_9HYPO|nr:unnamed protein product [Clonostachys byssicola]